MYVDFVILNINMFSNFLKRNATYKEIVRTRFQVYLAPFIMNYNMDKPIISMTKPLSVFTVSNPEYGDSAGYHTTVSAM